MSDSQSNDVKTYRVPNLYPAKEYIVNICDSDHQPVKNIVFYYSFDGEDQQSATTDESGKLSLKGPKPASIIRLSVA